VQLREQDGVFPARRKDVQQRMGAVMDEMHGRPAQEATQGALAVVLPRYRMEDLLQLPALLVLEGHANEDENEGDDQEDEQECTGNGYNSLPTVTHTGVVRCCRDAVATGVFIGPPPGEPGNRSPLQERGKCTLAVQ
jgi:hypothetical protein